MSSILSKLQAASPAKPAQKKSDLVWEKMNISSLPDDMQQMVREMLKAQEAERILRKALQDAITDKLDLPAHLQAYVSMKWGQLSIGIGERSRSGGDATLADLAKRIV